MLDWFCTNGILGVEKAERSANLGLIVKHTAQKVRNKTRLAVDLQSRENDLQSRESTCSHENRV